MNLSSPNRHFLRRGSIDRKRKLTVGSSLLLVLILTSVLTMTVSAISRIGMTESKAQARSLHQLDTHYAAEAALKYGMAQIIDRWLQQPDLPADELAPHRNPVKLHSEFLTFFARSPKIHFDLDGSPIRTSSMFLSSAAPSNSYHLHKGRHLNQHSVHLYAKATTTSPLQGTIQSYVMQTLQACDVPLFSYLLFYDMDLELHPGVSMNLNGPIHANGNIWLQSDSTLTIEGPVSASGSIRYGWLHSPQATQTGRVYINDRSGTARSLYQGSGPRTSHSSYWHSRAPAEDFNAAGYNGWRDFSLSHWGGNLQDASHSVPILRTVHSHPQRPTQPTASTFNHGYILIEPNQPAEDPLRPGYVNPLHKGQGEKSKYAHKAGLTIRLHLSPDGITQHDGSPLPSHAVQLRARPDQNDPQSTAVEYAAHTGIPADTFNTQFYITFNRIARYSRFDYNSVDYRYKQLQVSNPDGTPQSDTNGNPLYVNVAEVREIPLPVSFGVIDDATGDPIDLRQRFEAAFAACHYAEDPAGNPVSSFYDPRRQKGIDIVEINLQALAEILENNDLARQLLDYNTHQHYNGIVYVEFPTATGLEPRTDHIVTSIDRAGLLLSNASRLPAPQALRTTAVHSFDPIQPLGFSLATNNALYVKGHFNADGDPTTGTASQPDNPRAPNPPATLAADAIMPLSENWRFENSRKAQSERIAVFTEYNTALIQGIPPTSTQGKPVPSGGSHNFPRFLESWQNTIEFRFRGSMAAMYNNEICTEGINESVYTPPLRNWGFCDGFRKGHYPPGMPFLRFFQTTGLRHLSASEYTTTIQQLW